MSTVVGTAVRWWSSLWLAIQRWWGWEREENEDLDKGDRDDDDDIEEGKNDDEDDEADKEEE